MRWFRRQKNVLEEIVDPDHQIQHWPGFHVNFPPTLTIDWPPLENPVELVVSEQTYLKLKRWDHEEWGNEDPRTWDEIIRTLLQRYQELADRLDRLHQDSIPL